MVRAFHLAFRLPAPERPAWPDAATRELRIRLIEEEAAEFADAVRREDMAAVADALADLLYVTLGAAETWGIDLHPIFAAVHEANMAKLGGGYREDGKVLKPEGWRPPDVAALLARQVGLFPEASPGGEARSSASDEAALGGGQPGGAAGGAPGERAVGGAPGERSAPGGGPGDRDPRVAELESLVRGEPDWLANLANAAAFIYGSLPDVSWCGFYLLRPTAAADGRELVLGPFQGKPACLRIPVGRGVCGTSLARRETLVVPDVDRFPGHIACDPASRSEVVVPIVVAGEPVGVLDLDSQVPARFGEAEARYLEACVASLIPHVDWRAACAG